MSFVLDSSAILAYIEDELGADVLQTIFDGKEEVFLPWPVLMEVYYMSMREKGKQEAETRFALLKHSSLQILWEVDEPLLLSAATIKANHKMSFADAMIASYAIQNNAILVHKDPEYESLANQIELKSLPYK
jgi:predicted nucleic acid-binding protein